MSSLEEVNDRARNGTDFQVWSFDGSTLLILGSFDLCYYHDIELYFGDVSFIHCPTSFTYPKFADAGQIPEGHKFLIRADEGEFEIIAGSEHWQGLPLRPW